MKAELTFRPLSGLDMILVKIDGPPDKVEELVKAVKEAAKKWENWEEE